MSDAPATIEEMTRAMAKGMESFASGFKPGKAGDGEDANVPDPREVIDRMTQVHLAFVNSGFQFMSRWTEASARAYPMAVRVLSLQSAGADAGGADLGAAMDDLRGALRDMSELPMRESRRLQSELADLAGLEPRAEATESPAPKRRVRMKR